MANNIIKGRVNTHVAQSIDNSDKTTLTGHWSVKFPEEGGKDVGGLRRIMRKEVQRKAEGETYSALDFFTE